MKRALIIAALWASSARGDALHATREQPLLEVSHTVDITMQDGVATYKVRRVFANPGTIADEAGLAIDLPYGAAATGLRIRAHATWFDGELMERDKAAELYHELTGLGAYKPKDPALLQWLWADKLYLQIFPVIPSSVSTVEYTLTVPTRYAGGRYWLSYPRVDAGGSESGDRDGKTVMLATPVVTVHASGAVVDGHPVAADMPVVLTPPPHEVWMEDPSASYVSSTLDVPASSHTTGVFTKAKLSLDIRHTYKSDLRVDLITPEGKSVRVHDGSGGSGNDIVGAFEVALPGGTHGAGTWRLVVSDHAALDTGTLDAWSLQLGGEHVDASGLPIFIPDAPESGADAGVASIAIDPPHIDTWAARLGKVIASSQHSFARLEVDVAPQVRPLPKRAQVVFVVDASYSIGEDGLAAEIALIRAYLSHVPDAEVEVVAYRRRAERVFGSFVRATEVDAALAMHPIKLGNGSAIDEGSRLAASLLATRSGPRRVVIASDELLRTSLTDPAIGLAALPADAVVHVVQPILDHDDQIALTRDDTDWLAPLATRHHGIFAELHGFPAPSLNKLAPAVLELVRPTRIDQLEVAGIEVADKELREGTSLRIMVDTKAAPEHVVLTGKLWSDRVRREVDVGGRFSRQTAAFVFGEGGFDSLSNDEMMKVAWMGRAVSPVTSYVAFEPGTRPSPIGIPFESQAFGGVGAGRGHGSLLPGYATRIQPDLKSLLDVAACERSAKPPAGWHVALVVETTKDEVVDVAGAADAMGRCLAEQVWALRLGSNFDLPREVYHLEFR
jgi:subtilisin-like proprotein convertase family protein